MKATAMMTFNVVGPKATCEKQREQKDRKADRDVYESHQDGVKRASEVARDETDCGTQDGPQNQRRHPDRKRDASAE